MRRVVDRIEAVAPALVGLSHQVHAATEIGFAETRSVAAVAKTLAALGFDGQVGGYGLDTAFQVSAGGAGPRIGVLAEYDALPDIGHGCGHNIICATAVGAFLGLAEVVGELGGSVTLYGTPAEENDHTVAGHLNLVTVPNLGTTADRGAVLGSGTGEVLARLPYHYTVG
jgi:metal-dependent amidase/aminoacylase/carboxypeptidase family protein